MLRRRAIELPSQISLCAQRPRTAPTKGTVPRLSAKFNAITLRASSSSSVNLAKLGVEYGVSLSLAQSCTDTDSRSMVRGTALHAATG